MSRQGVEDAGRPVLQLRRKPLDSLLLERLAETGFLATEFGMDEHAERIFQCLAKLRPGKPSPLIALGMVHARRGMMDQAIAELREIIAQFPESDMARAVLGTMLVHIQQPGALQLFEEVIAHDTDPGAVGVANSCIDLARKQESQVSGATSSESFEFFRHYNVRA